MESSSKRRRRCRQCAKKKHLYLVLDDWKGGYSIHRLDADNMEDHLAESVAALRLASPELGTPMAFTALGTNIFASTNPHCSSDRAPPILVYDTETASLTIGPRPPDGCYLRDLGNAVAVGGKLYALASVCDELDVSCSLQVLSWGRTTDQPGPWDPTMAWCWNTVPTPIGNEMIISYALHPDGRTIFMSTDRLTHSFDTSNGVWRNLGEWTLPFHGQAFYDGELDGWVGLHHEEDGYVCCCPVASRSAMATRHPECRVLKEKLFRRCGEEKLFRRCDDEKCPPGRYLSATLTYMGDSRFCLVENVLRSKNVLDSTLHVTLFGLKYDDKGELTTTKIHRTTRSYALAKNTMLFSHATFWM